jgi:hypothetical protein
MNKITVSAICDSCKGSFYPDKKQRSRKKLHGCNIYCSKECRYRGIPFRLEDSFWSKVDIVDNDKCWEWQATRFKNNYGNFRGKCAHRMAYKLSHGDIPYKFLILHKCDNPPCCNPDHLFVGTHKDNARDMKEKNRQHKRQIRTECANGHLLSGVNMIMLSAGTGKLYRGCRICNTEKARVKYLRKILIKEYELLSSESAILLAYDNKPKQ